jgi:hypothetical protein
MFEVSRVINAGREQDDDRFPLPVRGDVTKNVEKFLAVILHWPDPILPE